MGGDEVGWTAIGAPPVFVDVPVFVPVRFWHRHPHAWRLEVDDRAEVDRARRRRASSLVSTD
jgi:hypothetical protein